MLFAALTAQRFVRLGALPVGSETRTWAARKVESRRFCNPTEPRQNGAVLIESARISQISDRLRYLLV
jgi:hypothetical protein